MIGSDWDFLFHRVQQLAIRLARTNNVTYLGTYPSFPRRIYDLITLQNNYPHWFSRNINRNLKVIPGRNLLPYRSRLMISIANLSVVIPYSFYAQTVQKKYDLIVVTLPIYLKIVNKIRYNKLCYDCFDDNPKFFADNKGLEIHVRQLEYKLLQQSDFVITSSARLYESMRKLHKEVFLIRNGVDFYHFCRPGSVVRP